MVITYLCQHTVVMKNLFFIQLKTEKSHLYDAPQPLTKLNLIEQSGVRDKTDSNPLGS